MCFSDDIGIIYPTHRIWISRLHSDCEAVRLFTMDFTKAFDSVNHSKLSAKFRSFASILPESIGTIASCLPGNSEFPSNNHLCNWKAINKGTTQGRVSGSFLYI